MEKQHLAERTFGVNANRLHWKITHKARRLLRPTIGRASITFDWSAGITGRPVYNIKNQFTSSSCWGQAFSRWVQIFRGFLNIEVPAQELSAKSAYSPIVASGGGVYLPNGFNEAKNIGLTTEALVPSYINGTTNETFMTDTSWRTNPMIQDCLNRANLIPVNIPIDIDSIACAIRDYGAVMFEVQGQDNNTWLSSEPTPPSKTNPNPLWAHYVCSDSSVPPTNTDNKRIRFYNSWGNIGENGFQYFDEVYIDSGFIVDCFAFIVAQPTPTNWWANFLNLLGVLKNIPAPKVA